MHFVYQHDVFTGDFFKCGIFAHIMPSLIKVVCRLQQPVFIHVVNNVSFAYPFPDLAALMELPYISRSSAVRPTLQTFAPIL